MSLAQAARRSEGGERGARAFRRVLGVVLSAALHLGALLVFINLRWAPPPAAPASLTLTLVADPRPPAPEAPPSPTAAVAAAAARASPAQPLKAPRPRIPRAATPSPLLAAEPSGVSEAELAGATIAGGGAGGGGGVCDMAQLVQTALRKDPLVRAAVAAGGETLAAKAVRVWNGDWVTSGGQDGKGLAAVREAVAWEVGFAPRACRETPVHGLVLISLADAPGAARFVIGLREWRWSDLLGTR